MTPDLSPEAVERVALDCVTLSRDMCNGTGRWRMTIPVDEERDYDVIVCRAAAMLRALLAECESLSAQWHSLRLERDALSAENQRLRQSVPEAVREYDRLRYAEIAARAEWHRSEGETGSAASAEEAFRNLVAFRERYGIVKAK